MLRPRPLLILAAVLVALRAAPARPYSSGPLPNKVGLCAIGGSCADFNCHDSYALNSGTASSRLALDTGPVPTTYTPRQLFNLILSVVDPDSSRHRFGFEIAAVSACPFAAQAGTWSLPEAGRTKLVSASAISYAEHTCGPPFDSSSCGYIPLDSNGNSWKLTWLAPAADVGPVSFYWAINSANGDTSSGGDYVKLFSLTLDPLPGPLCPGRVDTLRACKASCDPTAPGAPRVALAWTDVADASGYHAYRTADATALTAPATSGATLLATTCDDPPPGPALTFYTVVGLCADQSDGPS